MRTAAANFARIMIRPRATMRGILDAGRDRMIIPLVALAALSSFLGDLDRNAIEGLGRQRVPMPVLLGGLILGTIVAALILFYLFTWVVFGIGKLLEGTGTAREVRSAAAWGAVPVIWALVYRLPVVLFWPESLPTKMQVGSAGFKFDPALGTSCLAALVIGIFELAVVAWWLAVASNTIGEAHRFSSWRGLATIVLTVLSPALVTLAAVLAM